VIRINSQSGKGGVAFILEKEHGLELPRLLQIEFSGVVQAIADGEGVELSADRLWAAFSLEYLEGNGRFALLGVETGGSDDSGRTLVARLSDFGTARVVTGHGNGPIDGFVDAMRRVVEVEFDVENYREHALGSGANAAAVAYLQLRLPDGSTLFGVGIDKDIVVASLKAVLSGVNRVLKKA
jgi:2-isopropylmalate synthase